MGAILDPDEIQNAQQQIGQPSPAVPVGAVPSVQGRGPILDPDELAHARSQLEAPAPVPTNIPSPALPGAVMQAAPDRGIMGKIDDAVRMTVGSLPFADRFAARMDTLTGTGLPNADYAKNLSNEQHKDAALRDLYPTLSKVLPVVGGVAGTIATAPEAALAAPTAIGKALAGATTGAAYGGAQGASNSPDLTSPQAAVDAAKGAAVGALTGGAMPSVASGITSAANAGANLINGGVQGISREAAKHLLPAMAADDPAAVAANLGRLGPNGMLLDSGQALLGKAQGAALNSDDARSTLNGALLTRDAGTNARLAEGVNSALGPATQTPLQIDASIKALRSYEHSALPQIFENAGPVDATGVLATVGQGLTKAVGPEASVLGKARDWLMENSTDAQGNPIRVPVTDPQKLQNAKMAIDTLIDRGDPSLGVQPGAVAKSQGAIGAVRGQLNQALRVQVPGYGDVMGRSAALARKADAIETGYNDILGGGQNALHPADLNDRLAAAAKQGPEVLDGYRIGARAALDRATGTKANDLVALRNIVAGEGDWNRSKLASIFGAQPTNALVDSIDQNSTFRNSLNKVVENSQTAQRTAALNAMKPGASTGGVPLINPNMTATGLAMTPVKAMASALMNQFRADPTRSYGEIARVLSAEGPQAQQYQSALVDALQRRGGNAAAAKTIGDRSALAAALIGGRLGVNQFVAPTTGQ